MKNIFSYLIIFAFVIQSCTDDDKLNVLPGDFARGTYLQIQSTEGDLVVNKSDPENSTFTIINAVISPENATDVQTIELYVSFNDETVEDGATDFSSEEILFSTFDASVIDFSGSVPTLSVEIIATNLLSAFNLTEDQVDGGDTFDFRYSIISDKGTFSAVSNNFDAQSADMDFIATVVCNLPIFPAGVWTIEMTDSYGDGWQTVGNGGPGITITLNDGTVFEVGLCTPYEPNTYDCTDESSSGTTTITIPENTTSAVWNFPGDTYSEIGFTITSPNGNIVATGSPGTAAGTIALNLCNE